MQDLRFKQNNSRGVWKSGCQIFTRQFDIAVFAIFFLLPFGLVVAYLYPYYAPFFFFRVSIIRLSLSRYWCLVALFLLISIMVSFLSVVGILMVKADFQDSESPDSQKIFKAIKRPFFRLFPRVCTIFVLGWLLCLAGNRLLFFAREQFIQKYRLERYDEQFIFRSNLLLYVLYGLGALLVLTYLLGSSMVIRRVTFYIYTLSPDDGWDKAILWSERALRGRMLHTRILELLTRLPILLVPVVIFLFSWVTGEPMERLLGGVLAKVCLLGFISLTFLFATVLRAFWWHILHKKAMLKEPR